MEGFLAKIELVLAGKELVLAGLAEIQKAMANFDKFAKGNNIKVNVKVEGAEKATSEIKQVVDAAIDANKSVVVDVKTNVTSDTAKAKAIKDSETIIPSSEIRPPSILVKQVPDLETPKVNVEESNDALKKAALENSLAQAAAGWSKIDEIVTDVDGKVTKITENFEKMGEFGRPEKMSTTTRPRIKGEGDEEEGSPITTVEKTPTAFTTTQLEKINELKQKGILLSEQEKSWLKQQEEELKRIADGFKEVKKDKKENASYDLITGKKTSQTNVYEGPTNEQGLTPVRTIKQIFGEEGKARLEVSDSLREQSASEKQILAEEKKRVIEQEKLKKIASDYHNELKDILKTQIQIGETVVKVNASNGTIKATQKFFSAADKPGVVNATSVTTTTKDGILQNYELAKSQEQVTKATNHLNPALAETAKKSESVISKMKGMAERAMMVAPIWMILRSAIQGVQQAVATAIGYIVELDTAMARMKSVLQGGVSNTKEFTSVLLDTVRSLTLISGKSAKDVSEVFYRFAERGVDASFALSAMNSTIKLAVGIMGDSTETATVSAQTFELLGKSITGAKTDLESLQIIQGLIATMWQKNAFELNDFNAALKSSGTTLREFGVGGRESIALLATFMQAGMSGSNAATALNRLFADLSQHADKIQEEFNIVGEPGKKLDSFNLLVKVLEKIKGLGESTPEQLKVIYDIFEKKGAKGILALLTMPEKFNENLKDSKTSVELLMVKLEELYKIQFESIQVQIQIQKNLSQEIYRAAIIGITGQEEFGKVIMVVNQFLREQIGTAYVLGETVRKVGDLFALTFEGIDTTNPIKAIQQISDNFNRIGKDLDFMDTLDKANDYVRRLSSQGTIEPGTSATKERIELNNKLNVIFGDILENTKEETTAKTAQAAIEAKIGVEKIKGFSTTLQQLELEKQLVETSEYAYEGKKKTEKLAEIEKQMVLERAKEEKELSEMLIENELDKLKVSGATERALFDKNLSMRDALGLGRTEMEILQSKFDREKLITEEKKNQNKISSEAMKIFEISKKYGQSTATNIAGALQGKWGGIEGLSKQDLEVFKTELSDQFKNYEANKFYKENNYLRNIVMPSKETDTSELKRMRDQMLERSAAVIQEKKPTKVEEKESKKTLDISLAMNLNLSGSVATTEEINKSMDLVEKAISSKGSPIRKGIEKVIEEY